MTRYLATPITAVWVILAALMALSWLIGNQYQAGDSETARYVTVALMVVAFFKVRLVMLHFMEAKDAPFGLRLLAEAWVVGVGFMVLLMYFNPLTAG